MIQQRQTWNLYDAIFPSLPVSMTEPANLHTQVTQIFDVAIEEGTFDQWNWSTSVCSVIMRDTRAHIEVINSSRNRSYIFLVNGKRSEVLEAKYRILASFRPEATKQINIPKEHHRWILGKQRQRLNVLEKNTGTKIKFPDEDIQSDIVAITGTEDGIEKVEYKIKVMSDEQLGKTFERISVPKIYHPFIRGPDNKNLSALIAETGTRINFPPPSVQSDQITVAGEKGGVVLAKKTIENIYMNMKKRCTTAILEVPKWRHKYVVGPRKRAIGEILQLTGVSVEVPPSNSPTSTITLRGPQDKLGQAVDKVYEKANSTGTACVEAPAWIHKHIIGHKADNIQKITRDLTNITIEFIGEENKIKIQGPLEEVENMRKELDAAARQVIDKLTFVELQIDPKYFKYIIGKSQVIVDQLKDASCAVKNVYEKDGSSTIRIESNFQISRQAETLESNSYRSYRSIITNKKDDVKETRGNLNYVEMKIPGQGQGDIGTIRGPKGEVDKYYKRLMKFVKEQQDNFYVHELPIFERFRNIIDGPSGLWAIREIGKSTNTKISLLAENRGVLTITGMKINVEKAKDEIQKIQREWTNIVTQEATISPEFYNSTLIGTGGGKLLRSIMKECGGVSIEFPTLDRKSDKVKITGPKDDVDKAAVQLHRRTIETMQKQLGVTTNTAQSAMIVKKVKSIEDEISIDPKYHKFFVSDHGLFLDFVSNECGGVKISFPRSGTDSNRVLLKGLREAVEDAKGLLEYIINDLEQMYVGDRKFECDNAASYDNVRKAFITAPRVQWGRKRRKPKTFIYY